MSATVAIIVVLAAGQLASWWYALQTRSNTLEAINTQLRARESERPKTMAAVLDQLDALGAELRAVDKDAQSALSTARSNRTAIQRLKTGPAEELADGPGGAPSPAPTFHIPGRPDLNNGASR